jgi:hypothetical protein
MSQPRKLEYFEDELRESPLGREVLAVVRKHGDEVMYLINKNRATMICWQRNKGPQFIRSVVDSGFEDDVDFIKETNGISIETVILQMAEVLQDNGSPELKQAIAKYTLPVLQMSRECNSLREVMEKVKHTQIA